MLLQAITIDDRIYEVEKGARSFANTHVFPGGCLPSQGLIADCLARVTDMRQVWLDDITAHYPPTLAAWRERFFAAWERLRDARLRRALPPPLGLLPQLLGGGLPRAADRRRAGALREAGRGGAAGRRRREPLLLIHGLGGTRSDLGAGDRRCSRPSARCSRSTCRASARRRRCRPRSSRPPPTWPRRCTSECARSGDRAPARRRQLARRLGGAGNGPRRLGGLGDGALPRRPLARAARRAGGGGARMLLRGSPWAKAARPLPRARPAARRRRARARLPVDRRPPGADPAPTPAAQLVLGWLDGEGYDGANRAMRTHVFDPAGYPEDVPVTIAWGEHDRLRRPAEAATAAPPAPASSSSPASATRRPGTTPSWSPRPCSRAARPVTLRVWASSVPANRRRSS